MTRVVAGAPIPSLNDILKTMSSDIALTSYTSEAVIVREDGNDEVIAVPDPASFPELRAIISDEEPVGLNQSTDVGTFWYDTSDSNAAHWWDGFNWWSWAPGSAIYRGGPGLEAYGPAVIAQGQVSVVVTRAASAPTTTINALWKDTNDDDIYRWDGSSWELLADANLIVEVNKVFAELASGDNTFTIYYQSAAPGGQGSAGIGNRWYKTDADFKPHRWNGTAWIAIAEAGGAIPTTDGVPPAYSPTPEITPTLGGFFVKWEEVPNADPIMYDIYMSTTSPVPTTIANRLGSVAGTTFLYTSTDATGSPLVDAEDYHFVIIARDADGLADPSTEVTETARGKILPIEFDNETIAWEFFDDTVTSFIEGIDTAASNAQSAADDAAIAAGNALSAANAAQGDVDTLNTTVIPALVSDLEDAEGAINTLNNTTIPNLTSELSDAQDELDTIGTVTIPALEAGVTSALGAASVADSKAVAAQTSADGKNTVWYQATAPTGTAHKEGDTWFDESNGNRINRWDGTNWVPEVLDSDAIADLAITNAKIANLDAAKITTGTLNADRIAAGSITTKQLVVADTTNLLPLGDCSSAAMRAQYNSTNPAFEYVNDSNARVSGGWAMHYKPTTADWLGFRIGENLRVKPGEQYRVSWWQKRESANAVVTLNFNAYRANGTTVTNDLRNWASTVNSSAPNGEWRQYGGILTIPAEVYEIGPNWKLTTTFDLTGDWYATDFMMTRAASADLIVDGAITADKVAANSITAAKLVLADFDNLIDDPQWSNGIGNDKSWAIRSGSSAQWEITTDPEVTGAVLVGTANGVLQRVSENQSRESLVHRIRGGDRLLLKANVKTTALLQLQASKRVLATGAQDGQVGQATNIDTGGEWEEVVVELGADDIPEDRYIEMGFSILATSTSGTVAINNPRLYRRATAELIVDGTISADKIATNAVTAGKILAGAVTTDKMTANSINGDRIAANTLAAAKIVAGSITTDRMTANSINGDRISANTLHADKIVANTITAAKMVAGTITAASGILADAVITTAKIGNLAVTNAKIGSLDAVKITTGTLAAARIGALSITADKIAANAITADKVSANAITGDKIAANAIDGKTITGVDIIGATITGTSTITGATVRTAASGKRIEIVNNSEIRFYSGEAEETVPATVRTSFRTLEITSPRPSAYPSLRYEQWPRFTSAHTAEHRFVNGEVVAQAGLYVNGSSYLMGASMFGGNIQSTGTVVLGQNIGNHSAGKIYASATQAWIRSPVNSSIYIVCGPDTAVSGHFRTTSTALFAGQVNALSHLVVGGQIDAPSMTSGGSANMNYNANNGRLRRVTSSRRYKTDIGTFDVDVEKVLKLEPKKYLRIDDEDPELLTPEIGFIAEDAEDHGLDEWLMYGGDGQLESFDYYKWVVALQATNRTQQNTIDTLLQRVVELEERMN